jgi:hypothetical protein
MAVLSSFEVLAEFLVPSGVLPPGAVNPFAIQGFWVQVSLPPGGPQSVNFNLTYQETTDFNQGAGQKALQAQVIDASGNVNFYDNFFASTGRGFLNQKIGVGQTLIYGVQCLPQLSSADAAQPQNGTGWRGMVQLSSTSTGSLIATPTQRLVYYSGPDITKAPIDAVVYAVPTASGGTAI